MLFWVKHNKNNDLNKYGTVRAAAAAAAALRSDLVGGGVEVGDGDVEQVVLQHVDERRDGDLDAVERLLDDVVVDVLHEASRAVTLLHEDDDEAGDQLEQLAHHHRGGRDVERHVTRAGVAHHQHERRVLQHQQQQTDVLHAARHSHCQHVHHKPSLHSHAETNNSYVVLQDINDRVCEGA